MGGDSHTVGDAVDTQTCLFVEKDKLVSHLQLLSSLQ
jgi:hypothetical protein